jgi:hypothetical protein
VANGTARLMALLIPAAALAVVAGACIGPEPQAGAGGGGGAGTQGPSVTSTGGMGGASTSSTGGSTSTSSTGGSTSSTGGMGGSGPLPGQLGYPCTLATQCNSFHCEEGVCCDDFCTDDCKSCLAANTGDVDGVCQPWPAYSDPPGACPSAAEACDGVDSCKLILGESCFSDTQCISGHCPVNTCEVP